MSRPKRAVGEKLLLWVGPSKDDLLAFPDVFEKKSPSGVKTARKDVELIGKRFNEARIDYATRYGKTAK